MWKWWTTSRAFSAEAIGRLMVCIHCLAYVVGSAQCRLGPSTVRWTLRVVASDTPSSWTTVENMLPSLSAGVKETMVGKMQIKWTRCYRIAKQGQLHATAKLQPGLLTVFIIELHRFHSTYRYRFTQACCGVMYNGFYLPMLNPVCVKRTVVKRTKLWTVI
jgi:hypothetical protein